MTTLQVIDSGEFFNVIVDGDMNGPCFTIDKDCGEWGCAPEDNRATWEALRERAGFVSDESVESALSDALLAFLGTPTDGKIVVDDGQDRWVSDSAAVEAWLMKNDIKRRAGNSVQLTGDQYNDLADSTDCQGSIIGSPRMSRHLINAMARKCEILTVA